MTDELFNLWFMGELLLARATWQQVQDEMGEKHLHKDDCDLEKLDVKSREIIPSAENFK